MSAADGRNPARMARNGEPIMDGGADLSALDWRLTRSMMARHQEQDPVACLFSSFERGIDSIPRRVKVHPMQVNNTIGPDATRAELAIPCAVERPARSDRRRHDWLHARTYSPCLNGLGDLPRQLSGL